MKTILMSLMAIAIVVGLVGAGTFAYFSDTETSTGNTFTAGTIELQTPETDGVVKTEGSVANLKPSETGLLTILLTPHPDSNPMHVWKHIVDITENDRDENEVVEPECVSTPYNGTWFEGACTGVVTPKNDIDRYIHFDLFVNGVPLIVDEDGWLLSQNLVDFDPVVTEPEHENGVTCYWIYLGILDPNSEDPDELVMLIEQSFHMDKTVSNWAQSDELTFTEEFFVEQMGGPGKTGDELPGEERGI